MDDEGNLQRRLVREDAVGRFSVFPERLAVIRRHDDERAAAVSPSTIGASSGASAASADATSPRYGSPGQREANGSDGR